MEKNSKYFIWLVLLSFSSVILQADPTMSEQYTYPPAWKYIGPDPGGPLCFEDIGGLYPDQAAAFQACNARFGNCYGWAYGLNGYRCARFDTPPYPCLGHLTSHDYLYFPNHPEYAEEITNWTEDLGSQSLSDDTDELETDVTVNNQICLNSSLDLKSGNVYFSQQAGPLTFSYNSLDAYDGPLGYGWTHDFNLRITENVDGTLFLKRGDGNRVWFKINEGVYRPDAKSKDRSSIVKNANGYIQETKYGKIYRFDASGKLIEIEDKNGNLTSLIYSGNDLTCITDSTGRNINIGVENGKIVLLTDQDGKEYAISYWTSSGLISTISDPLGHAWICEYYSDKKMWKKTDPSGNVFTYYYYTSGAYKQGKLWYATDPSGLNKVIDYNEYDNITTVTEKDGGIWTHKYSKEFNVPLDITDPYGYKTVYSYNVSNEVQSITYKDPTGISLTGLSFTYENGNLKTRAITGGSPITYSYDQNNRLPHIVDPTGANTELHYDANGNLDYFTDPSNPGVSAQIERYQSGKVKKISDPLGHETNYEYDQYDNLSKVTDATGVVINFTCDISGRIQAIEDALHNLTTYGYYNDGTINYIQDPEGNITEFEYDNNGNINKVTDAMANDTNFTYNYRGQPTLREDSHGKQTIFSYLDAQCSPCTGGGEELRSLTDAVNSKTAFDYDQRGLLTSVSDPLEKSVSMTYGYDSQGKLDTRTDRNQHQLSYRYWPSGKLKSVTYPDSSEVALTYDSRDWLWTIQDPIGTTTFTYDAAGRIKELADAQDFILLFDYDAAGNLTRITYPDQSIVTYTYDAANRLKTVKNWLDQQNYEEATYVYDEAGRLHALTNFNGIQTTYTFDGANRLTGISAPVASYSYTLDGNGNRTASVESQPLAASFSGGSTSAYGYNAKKNRLITAGAVSYTYDDEGQLESAGNTVCTFNYNHLLASITEGATTSQFFYNARGDRLRVERNGAITRYVYDPWGNLLAETDELGQITRKYIYGRGLLALATPSARYCYHFNGTGSTVAITDMNQAVVNAYAYEPFGEILSEQETIAQPFKFVGQYGVMAEPNGLYYMRARYYDPAVGRFISEDPIGFGGGDVNLFAYVQNDPVNTIDPEGLHGFFLFGRPPVTFRPPPSWRPPVTARPSSPPRITPEPRLRPINEPPPRIVPRPTPEKMPWWYWLLRLLGKGEEFVDKCDLHTGPSVSPLDFGNDPTNTLYDPIFNPNGVL